MIPVVEAVAVSEETMIADLINSNHYDWKCWCIPVSNGEAVEYVTAWDIETEQVFSEMPLSEVRFNNEELEAFGASSTVTVKQRFDTLRLRSDAPEIVRSIFRTFARRWKASPIRFEYG